MFFYLAEKYGLFVLEDAAHALEAKSNNVKMVIQIMPAFSFYANKNITTGGEGGAVSTNDKALSLKIRQLSLHGMSKDGWNRFKLGGKWQYDVTELGYKYNMTDIAASIGIWQMKQVDSWYNIRKRYFNKYLEFFKSIKGVSVQKDQQKNETHALHLFIITIHPKKWKINRNELILLLNNRGIGTSVHYTPVHMHSYYIKKYGLKR